MPFRHLDPDARRADCKHHVAVPQTHRPAQLFTLISCYMLLDDVKWLKQVNVSTRQAQAGLPSEAALEL